jgi:hypothetical protein
MQQCIKILLSLIYIKSTRFGRHTTHHQEPKTALAASGFFMNYTMMHGSTNINFNDVFSSTEFPQ